MRIAVCVPRASNLNPGLGGSRVFVRQLLAGLGERGHDVEVVSRLNVRHLWRGQVNASRLASEAASVARRMRRFAPDAWLVYGPSATNPDFFGWWQRPKRYVLFSASTGKARRLPRSWRPVFTLAYRRSLARADEIVPSHPGVSLEAAGVRPERLTPLVAIAIAPWGMLPSRAEARRTLGLPEDAVVVMCSARLTVGSDESSDKTSMVLEVMEAVDSLPREVMLVVAGDGPGRERVEAAAAQRRASRVRVFPPLEHAEMGRLYAASTLVAYPMERDWAWMAVLEAQACGRPVITMRNTSGERTVEHGRTGLLAGDMDEFRSHLAALTADPRRCEAMGEAAQEYIARAHSMDVRMAQIEALLSGDV
jgi:glycosyltransferase involved in cell wall biosynthesis